LTAAQNRWRQLTEGVPIHPAEPAGERDRWLGLDREERAAHTARIRGRLAGMTLDDLEHEREVARIVDHNASKVVLDEEDHRHQQAAALRLDLVDEALAWVRATGAAIHTPAPVTENS
jgi:hypothetical protein